MRGTSAQLSYSRGVHLPCPATLYAVGDYDADRPTSRLANDAYFARERCRAGLHAELPRRRRLSSTVDNARVPNARARRLPKRRLAPGGRCYVSRCWPLTRPADLLRAIADASGACQARPSCARGRMTCARGQRRARGHRAPRTSRPRSGFIAPRCGAARRGLGTPRRWAAPPRLCRRDVANKQYAQAEGLSQRTAPLSGDPRLAFGVKRCGCSGKMTRSTRARAHGWRGGGR